MAPLNRIIIDTDPGMNPQNHCLSLSNKAVGVDDVLAMLLALAAKPEEVEILMLSVTYGNVEVQRYEPYLPMPRYSLCKIPITWTLELFETAGTPSAKFAIRIIQLS